MSARVREVVVRRVLRRRAVLAAVLGGVGITLAVDLTVRSFCPPDTLPQMWRIRPRRAEVRTVVYAPRREVTMLWFGSPLAEYLMNWSGATAPVAADAPPRVPVGPPGWSSLTALAARDPHAAWSYHGAAFGFPFRSSTRETAHEVFTPMGGGAAGEWRLIGADLAHMTVSSYGTHVQRLAMLGASADILSYAAAIGSGVAFVETIRALRRRKRGCCLWCGYDRSGLAPGSPCPECGAATVAA